MSEIYLHSWTFRGRGFEEACQAAAAIGYQGVEVYPGHYPDSGDPSGSLRELAKKADTAGTRIAAVPLRADSRSAAEFELATTTAEQVFATAGEIGAVIVNCMVSEIPGPDWSRAGSAAIGGHQRSWTQHYAKFLAESAGRHNLLACLETHMLLAHDSAAAAADYVWGLDSRLGVNLDPANLAGFAHGETWRDAVETVGERILYLHAKNHHGRGQGADFDRALADGDIDWAALVATLRNRQPLPPICIEYSGSSEPWSIAARDFEFLQSVLAR